jgi:uncharacterized membrane protein
MLTTTRNRLGRERGQVVVLFALLLPVILTIGSVVVSAGNWYVLKRHLQTQVDSAALAGGQDFLACSTESATANAAVNASALKFSGDTIRSATAPYNLQLEDTGDQHVVALRAGHVTTGISTSRRQTTRPRSSSAGSRSSRA